MALQTLSGNDRRLLIGVQTAKGSPIVAWENPSNAAGKFFPVLFPFTEIGVSEQSDTKESETVLAQRRRAPSQVGQLWAEGTYGFEVMPEMMQYLIQILTNPATVPTGTAYADTQYRETTVSGDNAPDSADDGVFDVPSQIEIDGTDTGTMKVTGKRRIGKPQEEELLFTETVDVTTTVRKTKNYFSSVSNVNLSSETANNLVGDTLTAKPNLKNYSYSFRSEMSYLTFQMDKGGVPEHAYDLQIDSFTMSLGDIVTAVLTLTGRESTLYKRAVKTGSASEEGKLKLVDAADLSDFETSYSEPALNFFPRWGGVLDFNGSDVPMTEFNMEVNNSPDTENNPSTGSRFREPPVYGARISTLSPTVLFQSDDTTYRAQDNWQDLFRNQTEAPLTFEILNFLSNGKRIRITAEASKARINGSPVVDVAGAGAISVPLVFDCIPPSGGSELKLTIDAE